MMRRLFLAGLSVGLVVLAFAAGPSAQAQDNTAPPCSTTYNGAVTNCTLPTPTAGFAAAFAEGSDGPSADTIPPTPTPAPAAEQTDAAAPQLAFTGAESDVLAYVGSGLIAFGAIALAVHRRLNDKQ